MVEPRTGPSGEGTASPLDRLLGVVGWLEAQAGEMGLAGAGANAEVLREVARELERQQRAARIEELRSAAAGLRARIQQDSYLQLPRLDSAARRALRLEARRLDRRAEKLVLENRARTP